MDGDQPPPPPPATTTEYRAVWVDAFHSGIKSAAEVDALVANAQRANLNTLIVQVRKRGDAYCNNSLEPRARDADPAPYDPLAYLLTRAHAANPPLEVHAWTNIFSVGSASQVMQTHPDWATVKADGTVSASSLDPGHPDASAYTHDVLMHLVRNYDVDGIHFDYIRYPDNGDWGYNATAVAMFNAAQGRTGEPTAGDPAWCQWRRDQVTGFVRRFYQEALALKPKLKISAALIGYGSAPTSDADWQNSSAFSQVFQDWRGWLQEGILDFGVVMNYDREWSSSQKTWFDSWIEWEKDYQGTRRLLVGVGAYLNYPEQTFAQLSRARAPSALGNRVAGTAIYSYASSNVFSTADYYTDPAAAAALPRQPYTDSWDATFLASRAAQMNDWFFGALSTPNSYRDPALGTISTSPPFPSRATIPVLPWK